MEGERNRSGPLTRLQSKKIKISNQIGTLTDGEIPNLHPEIIVEILVRLPAKSIFKCRCVSKSWLSLISGSQFIKAHLDYSTNNANFKNHRIIFTLTDPCHDLKICTVQSLMFEHAAVASDVDYPTKDPYKSVWTVGSCNGIICLAIKDKRIYLWNPTLRESKKLPRVAVEMKRMGFYYLWGFGFNESDGDYKVVGIFCFFVNGNTFESTVKIYSLKTNSWKRIEDFKGGIPLVDSGKYASGKLHFLASPGSESDSRCNIVSLDLNTEVYGMLEQPNYGEGCSSWYLEVSGGCISVLANYQKVRADFWVLKEYGVKESWARLISIPYVDAPGKDFYSNPVLVRPNGEILLAFGVHLVVYNPKDNSFRRFEITNAERFLEADIYVESLVPLRVED